jgi:hypothetical protein
MRDVREQAARREKELKEELEAAGRDQRRQLTEMFTQQERNDKDREEEFRRALGAETRRHKELPAVPGDWETEMRERVEVELKERMAVLSKAEQELATREQRLRVAEKVRSR